MACQYTAKMTLIMIASSLIANLQADYKSKGKSTNALDKQATTIQVASLQGKASRLLSGSVAYGTQYWSYAKVD